MFIKKESIRKEIKRILDDEFMNYNKKMMSYVNFNRLTTLLNTRFNDKRFTVKVLAARTKNDSFIMKYRNNRFYCYKNKNSWSVEND